MLESIDPELPKGQLVELFPKKIWRMPLYWHSWQIHATQYQAFNAMVLEIARKQLTAVSST